MSSEERRKILQMVEEGRISPQEAANLMRALEADAAEAEVEVIETEPPSGFAGGEPTPAPEFEEVKTRARRFAMIPLWTGILVTVLSAWGIYGIQQEAGMNFWFYCLLVPLLLGVLLIALGSGGRSSRWIYINVDRRNAREGDGPRHITLGFPLPLGLLAWFFRNFGHNIHGMNRGKVEGIVQMMNATRDSAVPLMINVDDNDEHVQLFIG